MAGGPGGVEVGRAQVRVVPNTSTFRSSLEKYLNKIEQRSRVNIPLEAEADERSAIQAGRDLHRTAQAAIKALQVGMDVDTTRLVQEAVGAVNRAQAAMGELDVEAVVNSSGLASEARRAANHAQRAAGDIQVKFNLQNTAAFLARSAAVVKAASAALRLKVRMVLDSKPFQAAVAAMTVGLRFFGGSLVSSLASLPQFIGMIGVATVAIAGMAAPLAAAAAAAWSAISAFASLTAAMAVPAIVGAGVAIGGLVLAFKGMGDAISAADPGALAEAMADLSPAAQEAVLGIRALKDEFAGVGEVVQEAFWANLSNIGDLASLIEPLQAGMAAFATEAGNAAAGIISFVSAGPGLGMMETLISSGSNAMSNLVSAVTALVPGIVAVGAAAAPMFESLTSGITETAAAWSDKMVAAFESGDLTAKLEGMTSQWEAFKGTMSSLGGIVSGVFGAMSEAGQPFLGTLGQVIEETDRWVNSMQGQEALTGFFTSMSEAVGSILPVIMELANAIGTVVAPAIADLITQAGPGLQQLAEGLTQGLAGIAPALGPIGAVIGELGAALGPVVAILGEALGAALQGLLPAFSALTPLISTIGTIFAALAPVVGVIAEVLGTVLAAALQALTPAFEVLGTAVEMIAPHLQLLAQELGTVLLQAVTALAPLIPVLAEAFLTILSAVMPLLPIIIELASTLLSALIPVISALVPVIMVLVTVFATIVSAVMPVITIILRVVSVFAQLLAMIVSFVAGAIGMIVSFVSVIVSGFASMVASVLGTVGGWLDTMVGLFTSLASGLINKALDMWNGIVNAFSSGISNALSFVAGMPGRAKAALGNVGSLLLDSGKSLVQGFIDGIKNMLGAVGDAAKAVVQKARDFFPFSPAKEGPFSGHGWVLYSGRSLGEAFAKGMDDRRPQAVKSARSLMSAAAGNLNGYKADIGLATGGPGGSAGSWADRLGMDTSVHIGTLVAADPNAPMREIAKRQRMAEIKAGIG